jgi:hypothetical protein
LSEVLLQAIEGVIAHHEVARAWFAPMSRN